MIRMPACLGAGWPLTTSDIMMGSLFVFIPWRSSESWLVHKGSDCGVLSLFLAGVSRRAVLESIRLPNI